MSPAVHRWGWVAWWVLSVIVFNAVLWARYGRTAGLLGVAVALSCLFLASDFADAVRRAGAEESSTP